MGSFRIENLTFTYPNSEKTAIDNVSLTIERGEFVTLCGPSGCGKTTLLRQLKPSTAPHGKKSGEIYFEDLPLGELSAYDMAAKIGFVLQSPENQIVTDKVWHELAFGLESIGVKQAEIRLRVAEMANFFGMQEWFHKSVTELSGGQKQLLALASIMALNPTALILDEPTSQLDPIAASEFLTVVGKINRELGVTVILTEHRLEEALPLSNRAVVIERGRIIADGSPQEVGQTLRDCNHGMFLAMPTPMRVWSAMQLTIDNGQLTENQCPITVRDGANWLEKQLIVNSEQLIEKEETATPFQFDRKTAIKLSDVWFKYEKDTPDVVKGLSLTANYGEITAILGGNGTGKTTTLSLIGGLKKPYRGKICMDEQVYTLPQNPQSLFVAKTVREDLLEILPKKSPLRQRGCPEGAGDCKTQSPQSSVSFADSSFAKGASMNTLQKMVKLCRLDGLLDRHPYDLSGGEQQRAALAKVLLLQPKILLLDEPTKGLDAEFKQIFAAILRKLTSAGVAVIMVSHDVEFCAEYADRCALFFDGNIVTENTPREFFRGNSFYTTSANRMARDVLPDAVTVSDIVSALGGTIPLKPEIFDVDAKYEIEKPCLEKDVTPAEERGTPELSKSRKFIVSALILSLIATMIFAILNWDGFSLFLSGGNNLISTETMIENAPFYIAVMLITVVQIIGITLALTWKREKSEFETRIASEKRKLSKRTIVASALIFITIPLTIYVGLRFFGDRRFYFTTMLIILQTMIPFALVFESRKPQARELVIIAVLIGIAVAGRTAFFMLPQFKPVIAIVIIAGVAFGGETGFLVGAMTMFVSNMFFGQGPWAPWQMFAMGIIGFLAGILFRKGLLSRSRIALCVFGGLATIIIYGGIMNPASIFMWQPNPTVEMFILYYLQGIPFDIIHSAATVTFLLIISRPMLEKLDRIKVKYGLIE